MTRLVIVLEDHLAMRDALKRHLDQRLEDVTVVACASPTEVPASPRADLALVDLDLGLDIDSDDVIATLVRMCDAVMVMSAAGTSSLVQRAIRAGAWTYVPKTADLAELDAALSAWSRQMPYLSGDLAGKLVTPQIDGVNLADPQRRALALFSTGMSHRAISQTMGVTTSDVSDLLSSGVAAYRW